MTAPTKVPTLAEVLAIARPSLDDRADEVADQINTLVDLLAGPGPHNASGHALRDRLVATLRRAQSDARRLAVVSREVRR